MAILYSALPPDALVDIIKQLHGCSVTPTRITRGGAVASLSIVSTRSNRYPHRITLEPVPLAVGGAQLCDEVVAALRQHGDQISADREALVVDDTVLRLAGTTAEAVCAALRPHLCATQQRLRYCSDLPDAAACSTVELWSADIAGIRVSVKQPHANTTRIVVALLETADDLSTRDSDTVRTYIQAVAAARQQLLDAARLQFADAIAAPDAEPGPWPLWDRSLLALRLDFWRWVYWRMATSGKAQVVILDQLGVPKPTAMPWRKQLLEHFDEDRLHKWERDGLPDDFSIDNVVAALQSMQKTY